MRLIGIGLAVALAIGVLAPNAALAKPKAAAPAAGAIDPAMHKKGQDDVPALLHHELYDRPARDPLGERRHPEDAHLGVRCPGKAGHAVFFDPGNVFGTNAHRADHQRSRVLE